MTEDIEMADDQGDFDDQDNDLSIIEDGPLTGEANSEEPPSKKRRRSAKPNSDKKFECKHEGCGKSYSRAEHLYRHQLNRKFLMELQIHFLTPYRHTEKYLPLRLS